MGSFESGSASMFDVILPDFDSVSEELLRLGDDIWDDYGVDCEFSLRMIDSEPEIGVTVDGDFKDYVYSVDEAHDLVLKIVEKK